MRKKLSAMVLIAAAMSPAAVAAVFVFPSDRAMVRRADAIAVGTVEHSFSQSTARGGIETVTSFTIDEVIKGALPLATIEIHEPGGEFGGRAMVIPGVPRFAAGERPLLFLSRTPQKTWAVTEIALGKFTFVTDVEGRTLLMRSEEELVGWNPDGTPHREPRRDAERFLEFLRTEAKGGIGRMNYVVSHAPIAQSTTPSVTMMQAGDVVANAVGSPASYTSDLSLGRGGRWTVFPSPVAIYRSQNANANGVNAVSAAIGTWSNDCASNINYTNAGPDPCSPCHTGGLTGAPDGLNTVLFERNLSSIGVAPFSCSGSSYSGTLGFGGVTDTSGDHKVGTEVFWTTSEVDVEINQGVQACTALGTNFNSAIAHEVGHTLGFRHSDQTRANDAAIPCSSDPSLECSSFPIMRASVTEGLNAALQTWDKNAAAAVYPGGSRAPPPTPASAIRDFNGDGQSDVLWWNKQTGEVVVWYLSGGRYAGGATITSQALNWRVVAAADFDRDGHTDLVWRNVATGANLIWLMTRSTFRHEVALPFSTTNWAIEAAADMTGDGYPDIVWHDHNSGVIVLWRMNGTSRVSGAQIGGSALPWHVVGAADFNGDGSADLFWRNLGTGQNAIWRMSGTTFVAGLDFMNVPNTAWRIIAVADYNNDGTADLYWRNITNGSSEVWFVRNFAFLSAIVNGATPDTRWEGAGPR